MNASMEGLTSFVCGSFDASRPTRGGGGGGEQEEDDKLDVGMDSPPPQHQQQLAATHPVHTITSQTVDHSVSYDPVLATSTTAAISSSSGIIAQPPIVVGGEMLTTVTTTGAAMEGPERHTTMLLPDQLQQHVATGRYQFVGYAGQILNKRLRRSDNIAVIVL